MDYEDIKEPITAQHALVGKATCFYFQIFICFNIELTLVNQKNRCDIQSDNMAGRVKIYVIQPSCQETKVLVEERTFCSRLGGEKLT